MPDDPMKTKEDRKLVSAGQEYELVEFARKYDMGIDEAAALIKRYGPSRSKLDAVMAQRAHG